MNFNAAFICHPYHRGGVTAWMMEAYYELQKDKHGYFVTTDPRHNFFGNDKLTIAGLIKNRNPQAGLIVKKVGSKFELGTQKYRALIYARLIRKHIPQGTAIIPSDDEACWMACAMLASSYKVIGVLHSDDEHYYKLFKKYYRYLTGVVSVSQRINNKALKAVSDINISNAVVPCGIDLSFFKHNASKEPNILWIGRVEERQKRVSDIVPIMLGLIKENVVFTLYVYGDGPDFPLLLQEVEKNGLGDRIRLMKWETKENISKKLSGARLLLQTSNFEGMSVAVMEALASGCIVVSTRVSGIEDIEKDTLAQKVVKLYDIGEVSQAVNIINGCMKECSAETAIYASELAQKYFSISGGMKRYQQFVETSSLPEISYSNYSPFFTCLSAQIISLMRYSKWCLKKQKRKEMYLKTKEG